MKKLYMFILLTFISLSGMSYAMERDIPEKQEEQEIEETSIQMLPNEIIEKITLYITNASTFQEAYYNVKSFLAGIRKITLLSDEAFAQKLLNLFYEKFIPTSVSQLSQDEKMNVLDNIIAIVMLLEPNAQGAERVKKWLKENISQPVFFAEYMEELIKKNKLKKFIFVYEHIDKGLPDSDLLIIAAYNGNKDIIAYLIKQGVPLNESGLSGKTARQIAEEGGYSEIVAMLDEAVVSDKNPKKKDK